MRTGRTVTKQLQFETHQHEILGVDLGEGPKRKELWIALVLIPAWVALLWLIIGAPTKANSLLFMAPPFLFLKYGVNENERNPRRMNFTQMILALRYSLTGHRPIVRAGARSASRSEYMPLSQRWNFAQIARAFRAKHLLNRRGEVDWDAVGEIPGLKLLLKILSKLSGGRISGQLPDGSVSTNFTQSSGKPIEFSPSAYLYSNEELIKVGQRMKNKQNKRKKSA